ncbi:MAG: hypothetical protein WCH83_02145 [Alphaproteobacteria bacterium]
MTIIRIEHIDSSGLMARVKFEDGTETVTAIPSNDGPLQRAIEVALANGLTIRPFTPPPLPEPVIQVAWFRAALAEAGRINDVDSAVDQAGPVPRQLWDYATSIRRGHPMVVAIASQLQLDLDALFSRAEALRALNS